MAKNQKNTAAFQAAESAFYHSIKADQDREWLRGFCAGKDQNNVVALIRGLQKETAEALGYTLPAVRQICKAHGISALLPARLKMVLINKQRITPSVRAWIRKQQGVETAERAEVYDEPVEDEDDDEQIEAEEREAEGLAWAAKWQNATDEEIDAEVMRFGRAT